MIRGQPWDADGFGQDGGGALTANSRYSSSPSQVSRGGAAIFSLWTKLIWKENIWVPLIRRRDHRRLLYRFDGRLRRDARTAVDSWAVVASTRAVGSPSRGIYLQLFAP
jgi:hypothetical protein